MTKKIISFVVAVVTLLSVIHIIPTKNTLIENVDTTSTASGKKLVALTFDDGPNKNTEILLNGLRERNIKSTFFVMGKKAEKNKEIISTMHNDGHLIGNHTYSHINFLKSKTSEFLEEIKQTSHIISEITGEVTNFFRPPYGKYDCFKIKSVNEISVGWSLDIIDWKHKDQDYVYKKLTKNVKDGDIVLMHDVNITTVNGVLKAIDDLVNDGFEFARVDELLNRNGNKIKSGVVYRSCKDGKNPIVF